MCGFSYCSSVYCRSAAVTNSCINHCHDNTCNISCQTVRAAATPSWAKEVQMEVRRVHRPGWALGASPCLPAFPPVPLGADQGTSQGLIDVKWGEWALQGLALLLGCPSSSCCWLSWSKHSSKAGLDLTRAPEPPWNTQGGQFTPGSLLLAALTMKY